MEALARVVNDFAATMLVLVTTMLVLASAESAAFAADLPLVISKVVTGPVSHVELTNTSNQAATAWSLAITTHPGEGRTHRVVQTSDAYLAEVTRDLPRSEPHLDWLRAGQSREIPIDPQPAGATVELVAVVMEDGSAVGDPDAIAAIFDHRRAERDELHRVVDMFEDVLASMRGLPALEALKARLRAPAQGEESVPHRTAREAVEVFVHQATEGRADQADQSVRTYAAFVQRQYDVAARHAHRK
jgi:hypothetical protein